MEEILKAKHSNDSERSILGSLMIDPYKLEDLPCKEDDFFISTHKIIFRAISEVSDLNHGVDILTVAEHLESNKQLQNIGGFPYLTDLVKNTTNANTKRHAEIIKDKALVRELIEISSGIVESAMNSTDSASDIISDAESKIFAIMDKQETQEPVHINQAVTEAIEHLGNIVDGLTYQTTGLDDLDALLGGLRGGATYVVAGRSSMGKTGFMCTVAIHVATTLPIYIATLEMPRREIATRLMAIKGNVNIGNIKNWTEEDYNNIGYAAGMIKELKITIDEQAGLSLNQLRSRCRRMKRRTGLGAVFVDYLQLMKSKADGREREIAQISEGLKSLAKELDVPIIVLAQLNRECDKRADKRPLLSDLRESGSIEQDADVVMMLYRDEYYDKDSQLKGMAEVLVRKNRHGATGDIFTQYNAPTMHFRNKAYDWMLPVMDKPKTYSRGFD